MTQSTVNTLSYHFVKLTEILVYNRQKDCLIHFLQQIILSQQLCQTYVGLVCPHDGDITSLITPVLCFLLTPQTSSTETRTNHRGTRHNRNVNIRPDVCGKRQYAETVNSNIDIVFSKVWFSCMEYLAILSKQWSSRSYFINLQPQRDQ